MSRSMMCLHMEHAVGQLGIGEPCVHGRPESLDGMNTGFLALLFKHRRDAIENSFPRVQQQFARQRQ